eukprot:TRINITY_DN7321_c0_g1_i1.p1 TRINITY_DN7321_c0_g1~~TRINITY_DN7321_c0_g1_i1.p1  ORF type:complete len:270 (-),score=45.40 TRINITY_DN7321_c0_g1_i1:167-976(-)
MCEYVRGFRFMDTIYKVTDHVMHSKSSQQMRKYNICCDGCRNEIPMAEQGVLLCCGHGGCLKCLSREASNQKCLNPDCSATVLRSSIMEMTTIVTNNPRKQWKGSKYGHKINLLIRLIREQIPEDDRILIFVQFPDLLQTVFNALEENDLFPFKLCGGAVARSKVIELMQNPVSRGCVGRILVLNVIDESASGANLTTCNHAIFLHPLLTDTRQQYIACETQAIGRLRRYGQQKKVHIWRLLAEGTIDETIYNDRHYDWSEGLNQRQTC